MKISIENFKSIKKLQNFELKPMTILSGVNSAGKSSFVQFLLLLKQTIKRDSPKHQLLLSEYLYSTTNYKNIFHNQEDKNKPKISFLIEKQEFDRIEKPKIVQFFKGLGTYNCLVNVEFGISKEKKIYISLFSMSFNFADEKKSISFITDDNNKQIIETDSPIFIENVLNSPIQNIDLEFNSIFPTIANFEKETITSDLDNNASKSIQNFSEVVKIHDVKEALSLFFDDLSYIGPARSEPQEMYQIQEHHEEVGKNGEFVSQILKEKATKIISYRKLLIKDDGVINYLEESGKLLNAVKYWMCDIFNVAEDIFSEKEDDVYKIYLTNKNKLKTNIKHVGFGISQLLPIVVQGLLMSKNGVLIIEQPEIHLHPKIQSWVYDFLYSLTLEGKRILVETHSSHFITRMRRRIAEDETDEMDDLINLTFIENNVFRTLKIDDYGTILHYYPKDFIEVPNEELKAIVDAQMKKRLRNG
ncbi:MAG: AAA family ATPase [Flavobacteriales bacterium]|nr:AAA family ATPase [Flavobacteriales bacterium]